jgi:hydroxymethylbilane synthase
VRRQRQLSWLRPDLRVVDLRGNVPTRLRKLIANPWDAIVLARAGLERLGFDCQAGTITFEGETLRTQVASTDDFVPAGGQGIIALQIRSEDDATGRALESLNHEPSLLCLRAEREFLRLLQGDCGTPVGVLATWRDGVMEMRAQIFDDGRAEPRVAALRSEDRQVEPEALAAQLFERINDR